MAKLSLKPTKKSEEQQMAEFVSQANDAHATDREHEPIKPWENPRVRDDVIKMVSLRMPEPYILKLQYLSDVTHKSQQELLREVVLPWLDTEVEKY